MEEQSTIKLSFLKPSVRNQDIRLLNANELQKLAHQNSRLVTKFTAEKLEADARKNWDQFYKRNKTNFFKDRHWTTSEFAELLGSDQDLMGKCFLECGCGVGNLVFPLLEENTSLRIYACDFSSRAIDFVKNHPLYASSKMIAFVADLTTTKLVDCLDGAKMDLVTLVFVLSAIHPSKLNGCLKNIHECMSPGGIILFRDYAVHDMTQVRFKPGHKISDNFYMRQDGTRTFFFTIELVQSIFQDAGFTELECCYVHCRTVNKKEGIDAPRTFVQAKFKKMS